MLSSPERTRPAKSARLMDCRVFIDEMRAMMKECEPDINSEILKLGRLSYLPILQWAINNGEELDAIIAAIQESGDMTPLLCRSLISLALPKSLMQLFLSPSSRDPLPPSFISCFRVDFSTDYDNRRFQETGLDPYDLQVRRYALMGMMAIGVHSILGDFLGQGEDAVKALHHPGDPELKLDLYQRLHFGIIREVLVFSHFECLEYFWLTFRFLKSIGRSYINYSIPIGNRPFDRQDVYKLLGNDVMSLKMYHLLLDFGCNDKWVNRSIWCMRGFQGLKYYPPKIMRAKQGS